MTTSGALAKAPKPVHVERPAAAPPVATPEPAPHPTPMAVPRQIMLFPDRLVSNVVPFDGVYEAPAPLKTKTPVVRTSTRVRTRTAAPNDAQASLEFLQPLPPAPKRLSTTVEAMIVCDAEVAAPMHRACAAAVDASWILMACGIFLTVFHFLGGPFPAKKPVILVMAAAGLLIAMFYGFIWVCAGRRTPGMRALHLTLINFDGYPADSASRWLRYMGECLSYFAGGLGLLWAILDEESLAWHDHISKTFPTFHGPETSFVRRR